MNLFEEIKNTNQRLQGVIYVTPLTLNINLSEEYQANIYLKREDLQVVRSYKIRGAYNKISQLNELEKDAGIVCASAGNHAQGVAYSCNILKIFGKIYMPTTTPKQKVKQVRLYGKEYVKVVLVGDTFDDAYHAATIDATENNKCFIHPFNDEKVIAGQGTVGLEIMNDCKVNIDYLFLPVGGGGLSAGVSTVFKQLSPNTIIIGVEPQGAPAMKLSIEANKPIILNQIDKFVDGAAVKQVGDKTLEICKKNLNEVALVPEGKICTTILKMYNEEAIVVEPAGALSISVLDFYKEKIKGKNVVCIVSGSNNDIERTEEIKERSLIYEGLKHYFMVKFPQRPGALKEFVNNILSENDDITYFQFAKKNNRENAPVVVGLETKESNDIENIKLKMKERGYKYQYLNENEVLFSHFIG